VDLLDKYYHGNPSLLSKGTYFYKSIMIMLSRSAHLVEMEETGTLNTLESRHCSQPSIIRSCMDGALLVRNESTTLKTLTTPQKHSFPGMGGCLYSRP
jgi:hypothetical protein